MHIVVVPTAFNSFMITNFLKTTGVIVHMYVATYDSYSSFVDY